MTATTQSNGGLPWQTRRSAPSTRQIRQVANTVEESNRSTWNDSVVRHLLLLIFLILGYYSKEFSNTLTQYDQ
jgi:hypothetical protein